MSLFCPLTLPNMYVYIIASIITQSDKSHLSISSPIVVTCKSSKVTFKLFSSGNMPVYIFFHFMTEMGFVIVI